MTVANPTIRIERRTRETDIRVAFAFSRSGGNISTTVPFLDHMLTTLARYAGCELSVAATGDLRHHIIEDVALTIGEAVARALPATAVRYGERTVPMDDALVQAVIDTGGRAYYAGQLPSALYDHWMRSFATAAHCTLHQRVLRGTDRHHVVEAAFKALGFALRDAARDGDAVFSTKGAVLVETR
jgi:imidazoleglycerol-phosphate dehydratase